jgi:hypothetical protein
MSSDSPMLHQELDDSPMLGGEDWEGDVCEQCGKRILETNEDYICDEDGVIRFCSQKCADENYDEMWVLIYDV